VQSLVEEMGGAIAYVEIDASKDTAKARQYQVQAVPTIVVLDSGGKIVDTFVGTPGEKELQAAMDEAVAR
jgi:thioredoxin-like negative regulator of GroEL